MKSLLFAIAALLAACAPATPSTASIAQVVNQTQAAWTRVPSQTAYPTYTPFPTYTPQQTYTPAPTYTALPTLTPVDTVEVTQLIVREVIVTATPLPAPTQRPTPVFTLAPLFTSTPAGPTQPPPPTVDVAGTQAGRAAAALLAPRPDGNYLVGVDIGPGVWRNDGSATTSDDCYWERLTKTGDIIDNYIGAGNGTMFVAATDFQVHMERCGTWTYIGQ